MKRTKPMPYNVIALSFIESRWQAVSKPFTHADWARGPASMDGTERRAGRVSARPKTSMPESTEAELLARVARGDTDAFSVLYDLHAGALFGLALRILRNHATAEDAHSPGHAATPQVFGGAFVKSAEPNGGLIR